MNEVVHSGNMIHHQIHSNRYIISLEYEQTEYHPFSTNGHQPLQGVHVKTLHPTPGVFPTSRCGGTRTVRMAGCRLVTLIAEKKTWWNAEHQKDHIFDMDTGSL